MRRVGQARKRDSVEAPIVEALRQVGIRVQRVSERGFADLICYAPNHWPPLVLLEVKSRVGTLTEAQEQRWKDGWPVHVVRSVDDALKACGVVPPLPA
jgi:hypothetical protein